MANMVKSNAFDQIEGKGGRTKDLVIVVGITMFTFLFSATFDIYEMLLSFSRSWEAIEIDELFPTILVGAIALCWYSVRRQKDSKQCVIERKQAEEDLKKEKDFIYEVLNNVDSLVVAIDQHGKTIKLNGAGERLSGCRIEEIQERPFWDILVIPEERESVKSIFADAMTKGLPNTSQYHCISKDSGIRLINWRNKILRNPDGSVKYILFTGLDITEQNKAEEALRNSEKRFRELADSLPQVIFETDQMGKLTYVNQNAYDLFGYTRNDFEKGVNALNMLIAEDRERAANDIARVLDGKYVEHNEYTGQRKDGTAFPISIHSNRIVSNNSLAGLRGLIIDLTKIKADEKEKSNLQTQLQHAQRMEAIGTLAGGIAHDFNNILTAIIGYTELAMDDTPKESLTFSNLKNVLLAANRVKDLVHHILTFSRQADSRTKPVYVKAMVKEAIKFLRASIPATIDIDQNIRSDSIVTADPSQISQVIMNLCSNAAHAMRNKGGILKISLEDVEIDLRTTEPASKMEARKFIKLTVDDTGYGIPPELTDRIFDPFFTTKERGEGTGMGLSVVHGLVEKIGGKIQVESKMGKGATFKIYMPVIENDAKQEMNKTNIIPIGRERILFVDDEAFQVDLGKQILERIGYNVITSTSSVEALELFRAKPDEIDLVVTDMTMPKMTGDKLAKNILDIRSDIPIILCTGYSEQITEEQAREIGIRGFAMKPMLIEQLAHLVREAIDQ